MHIGGVQVHFVLSKMKSVLLRHSANATSIEVILSGHITLVTVGGGVGGRVGLQKQVVESKIPYCREQTDIASGIDVFCIGAGHMATGVLH